MLAVRGLTKAFGERRLWEDISFDADAGEMLALVGRSGSGKTTFLNCLGGFERPTSGTIHWCDWEITQSSARIRRRLRKQEIGYLFQSYALVENATVAQNIRLAVMGPWPWGRQGYEGELEAVGLGGRGQELVYRLSGGEQQRVALARLIAKRPRLILADEPTGALDEENGAMVIDTLRDFANAGSAVVVATHNPAVWESCNSILDINSSSKTSFNA